VVAVAMQYKVMICFILGAHMAISANNINRMRRGKVLAIILFRGV
jgi:DNA-binding Xre family transcriptional regulator